MSDQQPVRVLHALGALNPGGIETWLVNVLRHSDPTRVRTDILVHTSERSVYDEQVLALGARILPCPFPGQPLRYARALRRILRTNGPYQAIHSHLHHFSGWVLRAACQEGVPVRIAHSHLDTAAVDGSARGLRRKLYLSTMKRWIARYATVRVGASRMAAAALFGPEWEHDAQTRIVYCGIDSTAFSAAPHPSGAKGLTGKPHEFVIGHVGRFVEQKNHRFLLEIAAEVLRREPTALLLLIGDGPLRRQIEEQAELMGLGGRVVFAGLRSDVPELLRQMNVFVMPSLFEGLPVVGLEAQAAGLPLVISDQITPELDFVPHMVRRLSLTQPTSAWADAILAARERKTPASARNALSALQRSPFTIQASAQDLEEIYCGS
jgi:glycosyltransferase involved in cell wall biosynthesis